MVGEGVRVAGCAVFGQVGRGGAQQGSVARHHAGHQLAVGVLAADTNRQIEAVLDDVGHAVGEAHFYLHVRPGFQIGVEQRQDHAAPEGIRQGKPQHPARRAAGLADGRLRGVDGGQNLHTLIVQCTAFIGQAQVARGAVEQAHAKAVFQTHDGLAGRRARKPHGLAARDKAGTVDHGHEDQHFIEVGAQHRATRDGRAGAQYSSSALLIYCIRIELYILFVS